MDISYHDFGYTGWITIVSGIILLPFTSYYVYREYKRKKEVSLSDIIGIISWVILGFIPVIGVAVTIVVVINRGITLLVFLMFKADEIKIIKSSDKELS